MARVSIEDCLENIENRFALVMIASSRARGLMSGENPLLRTKNKEAVTALREIADGIIEGVVPEQAGGAKKRLATVTMPNLDSAAVESAPTPIGTSSNL
jgi:DNA-directed RNA polymerase omega subunit